MRNLRRESLLHAPALFDLRTRETLLGAMATQSLPHCCAAWRQG